MIAFWKKEWLEQLRSGKLIILGILFVLFGIMNPAVAKLTPWLLEAMADSLALLNEKAPNDQVIKLKAIEAMQKVADGHATKIIIPSEMQGLVGLANGIVEGAKE